MLKALTLLSAIFIATCPGIVGFSEALEEAPVNFKDSKITAIDFYPSGAKFTFNVEPEDDEGNFRAVIPGAFDEESIRMLHPEDLEGDINIVSYYRTRWIPESMFSLKESIEETDNEIKELTAKRSAFEQSLTYLKDFEPEKSKPSELLEYIKNAQELRLETDREINLIANSITDKQEELKVMRREFNSRRPNGDERYIVITGKATDTVEFTAFTSSALWGPKYILNLNSNTGDVFVTLYVKASQKTGLDFEGDMIFHTKTPDERITTPNLTPLRVAIKPKEEKVGSVGNMSVTRTNKMLAKSAQRNETRFFALSNRAEEADEEALDYEKPMRARKAPVITETISDRTIELEGKITGDGIEKEINADIDALYLKSKPIITLIPEQRNDAWIVASMDEGNKTLIPGEAELRVDGYTSGKIMLGEYESQRNIPFGYADAITVKKEALVEKTGVSWFSGVFTSGYKLEITNGTSDERVITVRDRLPIPTDEKIKLDIKRIEPKETERDKENRLTWEITVPAGATVPIIVDYTLSYPSGEELLYR